MEDNKKKKTPPTEVLDDDFDEEEVDDEEEEEDDSDEEEEENLDEDDIDDDKEDEEESDEDDDDGKGHDDGKKSKNKEKQTQSKEERARYAQMRREREAKEREAREKKIREEAFLKGKLEANKVNTFTEKPIKDEYDLFIFETQKKLEAEGKDPIDDLPERLAEINREKAVKEKEEADKKKNLDDRIDKEFNEFRDKYPKVKITQLLKDPDFKDYVDDRIGRGDKTFAQLYEMFMRFKNKYVKKSKEEEEDDGKKTPPSPNGGRKQSKTSYADMSEEQQIKELRRQGLIN